MRDKTKDLLFISLYPPPRAAPAKQEEVYKKTLLRFSLGARTTIECMPARTSVFIDIDLNDNLGEPDENHPLSEAVGGSNPGQEHLAGILLREVLGDYSLTAFDAFGSGESTFFGHRCEARIDSACGPRDLPGACVPASTRSTACRAKTSNGGHGRNKKTITQFTSTMITKFRPRSTRG